MFYEILTRIIKKQFYIQSYERFKSETSPAYIERYVAKHRLLKPELIVVNDQPFGFKKIEKDIRSLEGYPIYLEIEYSQDSEGETFIDSFDLYSEVRLKIREHFSDILQLANRYTKTITLERIKRVNDPTHQVLLVYSKLNDLFVEEYFEEDMENDLLSQTELEEVCVSHMESFMTFIQLLDEIITHGKKYASIEQIIKLPGSEDS